MRTILLTRCFPGRYTLTCSRRRFPVLLEFFLVCRRRMHADSCVEPFCHGTLRARNTILLRFPGRA